MAQRKLLAAKSEDGPFRSIADLQDYVRAVESIFFRSDTMLDHARLNSQLDTYDPRYDVAVRRPEIDLLYTLDELVRLVDPKGTRIAEILTSLETSVFFSVMYHQLLFGGETIFVGRMLSDLSAEIAAGLDKITGSLGEECYRPVISQSDGALPASLPAFAARMRCIQTVFDELSRRLDYTP